MSCVIWMTPPPNISMWTILMILKSGNFFIPKQTFEYRNTSQFKNIYKALMKAKIFRIAKNIGMSFFVIFIFKMYSKQILHSSEPNAMSDSFCVENWFVTQIIWILQHRQAAYIKGKKCFDNGSLLRSSIVALKSVYGTKDEIKVSLKRFIRKTWLMIDSGGLKQNRGPHTDSQHRQCDLCFGTLF